MLVVFHELALATNHSQYRVSANTARPTWGRILISFKPFPKYHLESYYFPVLTYLEG